jgi:hypothetical protein
VSNAPDPDVTGAYHPAPPARAADERFTANAKSDSQGVAPPTDGPRLGAALGPASGALVSAGETI